jgi:gamma-butyrobetaine dioxygenase
VDGRSGEPALWPTPDWLGQAPSIDFQTYLGDDRAAAATLRQIAARGIAFLAGAGTRPDALERAVGRFGYIRETNYGRLFDVREAPAARHLAYTTAALELHTDNPYRNPVPTLQLLHVIEAAAEGGESRFVDGFAHAEALKATSPLHFEILAATPVEFAFREPSGERYSACAPVIATTPDGQIAGVRVNHRALGTVPLAGDGGEGWYDAYLDFYRRLHAPAARMERVLQPGEIVIFDNERILHGRSLYGRSGSARWLRGCYADRDGLSATLSRLSRPTGSVS